MLLVERVSRNQPLKLNAKTTLAKGRILMFVDCTLNVATLTRRDLHRMYEGVPQIFFGLKAYTHVWLTVHI